MGTIESQPEQPGGEDRERYRHIKRRQQYNSLFEELKSGTGFNASLPGWAEPTATMSVRHVLGTTIARPYDHYCDQDGPGS